MLSTGTYEYLRGNDCFLKHELTTALVPAAAADHRARVTSPHRSTISEQNFKYTIIAM